jgi:TRAP-type C4-dicarboxylate transport system permease small subunit
MSYESYTDLDTQVDGSAKSSVFGWIVDSMNGVGSILIFAIMLLICADVVSRNLLNKPIAGVAEIVAMSIIAIVFLQFASTLRHGRLIRADLFIDPFKLRRPRLGHLLEAFFNLCGLAVAGIIGSAAWPVFRKSLRENDFLGVESVFTAPTWPVFLIVVIGSLFAAIQFLLLAAKNLSKTIRGARDLS